MLLYHVGTGQLGNVWNYLSELSPLICQQNMQLHGHIETVLSDVLQTSKQHLLFLNSISTGLKGNVKSNVLMYAMPFPVIV